MSRYRQDMLLWPDGQPRVLNVDNRIAGKLNGVDFRVEIRGDFASCSLLDPHEPGLGGVGPRQRRMYQPHFNALGLIVACIEVSEQREFAAPMMGLRPQRRPGDGD